MLALGSVLESDHLAISPVRLSHYNHNSYISDIPVRSGGSCHQHRNRYTPRYRPSTDVDKFIALSFMKRDTYPYVRLGESPECDLRHNALKGKLAS